MNRAGPVIFCFAVACIAASMLLPAHAYVFFFIGCGVVGLASLAFVILRFAQGDWLPLLVFLIWMAVLGFLLFTPV